MGKPFDDVLLKKKEFGCYDNAKNKKTKKRLVV